MTKLHDLHDQFGQSPWLDNLKRGWITGGELQRMVDRGIRGVTSNPTILQKAITGGHDYDAQFGDLMGGGHSVEDSYWQMAMADIEDALRILRPVYDESEGVDGFVSLELAPALALDTDGSIASARVLHEAIDEPNLYIKIPGTAPGVPAIATMIGEGRSINVTLLFGLRRYGEVIDAYIGGLEALADAGADVSTVRSVASFFVSRVDTEVDRRLDEIGSDEAMTMRGKAAVANAHLAYQLFLERFSGEGWARLRALGAKVQRPLWASTSTKNPDYPDTLYVDALIGPDSVNTMPENTIDAFDDHGTLLRTVDADPEGARQVVESLAVLGIDMDDVADTLEHEGVASFAKSYDELLTALEAKADEVRP
ncbi:MAG: transaldolase [Acidimicrobiales bacterium]